jgi:hypothetical protein
MDNYVIRSDFEALMTVISPTVPSADPSNGCSKDRRAARPCSNPGPEGLQLQGCRTGWAIVRALTVGGVVWTRSAVVTLSGGSSRAPP